MKAIKTVYLSSPNAKLQKSSAIIYSFGLPAISTCPNAGACKEGCYGTRGHYLFKNVREHRERNYSLSMSNEFERVICSEVQYLDGVYRNLMIRIHDTGDFYSKEYANKWIEIAKANPEVIFYAYTKMIKMFRELVLPENFRIIQSFGGKEDKHIERNRAHAIVIPNEEELPAGYTIANDDDTTFMSTNKIAIVYHGCKKWENSGFGKLYIAGTYSEY